MADPQQIVQSQTTIPDYAKPYVENLLGQTAGTLYNYATDESGNVIKDATGMPVISGLRGYEQYGGERTAQFSDLQKQAYGAAQGLGQDPYSQMAAIGLLNTADRAANYGYTPTQYGNQFQAPAAYQAGQFSAQQVNAPNLQQYQMGPVQQVSTQSFARPGSADAYMSPYMQSVVAAQQREAERVSDIQRQQNQAQAVKSGAFGGSRQAIVEAERQRNLALQKGDIQAAGLQSAYGQAQQQFNAEQQARLQAALANQSLGYNVNNANLQALLAQQQLGSGQNMQAQLANQQYGLQAQQLAEQARQYGYGQQMASAGNMAQYGQAANQLNEQARQYGAGLGLQGMQSALGAYGNLGTLGNTLYNQNIGNINLQNQLGTQQQQQVQNILNTQYQDFLNQQNYPYKQLGYMSDMLRGLPLTQQSSSIYQAPPSTMSQVAGLGLGMYGAAKAFGSKKGGRIKGAGLADLAVQKISQE